MVHTAFWMIQWELRDRIHSNSKRQFERICDDGKEWDFSIFICARNLLEFIYREHLWVAAFWLRKCAAGEKLQVLWFILSHLFTNQIFSNFSFLVPSLSSFDSSGIIRKLWSDKRGISLDSHAHFLQFRMSDCNVLTFTRTAFAASRW